MAKPLYRKIEFCRNPKTLWGKLESKRYDWLGVHPSGQFVVGSPPVERFSVRVGSSSQHGGAPVGLHGVRVDGPLQKKSESWFGSEDEAKAAFEQSLAGSAPPDEPELLRVRRIENGLVVEEEYVVRRPTTYR